MRRKVEMIDRTFSVGKGHSIWIHSGEEYKQGYIFTKFGIVDAAAENSSSLQYSRLDFIWGERCYSRQYQKAYSRTWLSRLARSFAKEVADNPKKFPCRSGV